ncbi:hypothetical protein [Deinococcus soli (ex Cha et al. 2016)]|uniref:hypothetical protein n=1 Tax=Deinococcus soli (ex Cha et al. 2016) TaxID=1309411 RepID=UPI00166336F7|nr:hypothetical protein [Deinococcus soli (ex Cha et al. 2016)]GGB83776.1 hypothetical protein GCM10008019_44810 [Deinococcus soli (ex Cha et al. 2016)]
MPLGLPDLLETRILSADVQAALQHVADVFSHTTPRDLDPFWQEFWHPAEQAAIDGLPVRLLPDELMGHVLANVVVLIGGASDLKYFLPRLLELAIRRPFREELTAVLSRAFQAEFSSWPEVERDAVRHSVRVWWRQCLDEPVSFDLFPVEDALCAAASVFDDLSSFLEAWAADDRLNAALHLMNTARLHVFVGDTGVEFEFAEYWAAPQHLTLRQKWRCERSLA